MNRMLIAGQADQDQLWCHLDDWFAESDMHGMCALAQHLCEDRSDSEILRELGDDESMVVVRLALQALRELSLRNMRSREDD